MEEFTERERQLLAPYFSNLDKPVFALVNLPEVVKGALFSRYSRSAKSLRRVLLDEFMLSDESGLRDVLMKGRAPDDAGQGRLNESLEINKKKAEEFYERVLVGYGDDSVAELAGAHIALEQISILATKTVEDARIGLSPLEKSTRYVYFDDKHDGRWKYLREETLMASEFAELYERTCDLCFQTYADLIPKISAFVMEKAPKDDATTDRAYKSTVRAKTCDILRGLLPASTLTNMGFFGDGRAYEYLLTKMYADDLAEIRSLAAMMQGELAHVIPSFVRRANDKYGSSMQGYFRRVRSGTETLASRYGGASGGEGVELVAYDREAEREIVAAALYPHLLKPMAEVLAIADRMGPQEREAVVRACIGERENRRHKPGRAFEHCRYTFDICANYGAYRDLHRHRVLTQQRQELTPYLGFKMPPEILQSGYEKEFRDVMEAAKAAYGDISKKHRKEAQYVVPLAYNIRWYMTLNLREAYHMLELRSGMQGHPDYRHVAQEMFRKIEGVHPALASGMKFMDMKEYALERLEAEKKIDRKMAEISEKYGK
ncbi:MAG: FAD-dependent thymidylate synthase [Candidatus Micrarchaeota archaeon]